MAIMGTQDPRVSFFQQWLQAGEPDLTGIAGDLWKDVSQTSLPSLGQEEPSTMAAGPGAATKPELGSTEQIFSGVPAIKETLQAIPGSLGRSIDQEIASQTATMPPATRESAMPSMEEALKKLEESIAGKGSPAIPTPTPSAPARPTKPAAPTITGDTGAETGLLSPYIREPKQGETTPTPQQVERISDMYQPAGEVPMSNYEAAHVQPPVPTQASMDIKPEQYFLDQLEARRKAFPATPEAALQTVGKRKEDFQLAQKSTIGTLLDGMMAGAVGLNYMAVKDKKAQELKALENDYLRYAMAKFSHEDQIFAAKMQMERTANEAKKAGLEKQANMMIQNMGPNPKPQDLARIMSMLGASWGVPDEYVQRVLTEKWNPATGKYENMILSPTERANLEIKAKIDSMKSLFPGMPEEWYGVVAVGGKWKEFMEDMSSQTNFQLQKAIKEGNQAEVLKLTKKMHDIDRYMKASSVQSFTEMVQYMAQKVGMSPEAVKALIMGYAAAAYGGDKEIAQIELKGKFDLAKQGLENEGKRIEANAKAAETKWPNEIAKLKYQAMSRSLPIMIMFPITSMGSERDPIMIDQKQKEVDASIARVQAGQGTPEDQQTYQDWVVAAKKAIAQFPKAAPYVDAIVKANQVPNTPKGLQTLLEEVILIDQGIIDPSAKIKALGIRANSKPTQPSGTLPSH